MAPVLLEALWLLGQWGKKGLEALETNTGLDVPLLFPSYISQSRTWKSACTGNSWVC